MSEAYVNLLQWLTVGAFFLLVIAAMFAEAFWLSKKGWSSFGRALGFSALSNVIGFTVGLVVLFIVLAVFLMLTLDGTTQRIFDSKLSGTAAVALMIFAAILTPLLLIVGKRIFLGILKIQTGKSAWAYALVSSILIFFVSLGLPTLLGYFTFR